MNRLKDVFEDLAHDAPPIGDLAQRAVSRARRRQWISFGSSVTAAGLAVAGVTAVTLVVAGLPGASPPDNAPQSSTVPADSVLQHQPIKLPEDTPSPLPSGGVGPVALAYTLNCAGASDRPACASWRVLTVDGKHWRVSDAMSAGPRRSGGQGVGPLKVWTQPSGLAVSPDGRSLAYFREDGTFGIRDLRTGEFRVAYREKSDQVSWSTVSVVWSPDGGRLAVSYAFSDTRVARVVEAGSMRVTGLPAACCVLGVPGGDAPVLMYDTTVPAGNRDWTKLLVVGPAGDVQRTVPFDEAIALTYDVRHRYQWSRISPDGRSIVGLVDEDQKEPEAGNDGKIHGHQPDMQLQVVTISATTGEVGGRHPVEELRGLGYTKVLGWSGRSELLAADLTGDIYDAVKADDPAYSGGEVYAVNVHTGATRKAVSFTSSGGAEPTSLSLATDLL